MKLIDDSVAFGYYNTTSVISMRQRPKETPQKLGWNRCVLCLTGLQPHPYLGCSRLAGCVHSSVNKLSANGRVSYVTYDSLVEIGRKVGSELNSLERNEVLKY